jgi:hypothetical protein
VFPSVIMDVMGTVGVTTLHPRGWGFGVPPALKMALPSPEETSRVVSKDGDPLCTIPMKMAPESLSSKERLRRLRVSTMNSKLPKQMVSLGARPPPV